MLLKSCRCGKLIPQSMKMCEECEQRQQSRHMIYNNTRRDERAAEFYVSKEWRAMRERIIEVYDNVDIYALYVEHELLTCNPVHHIIELEDDWEQRLNPFNLIPLNHKTHNTRLIPIGKDGLMLNIDGKNYVENHQYSKKVKTMTWKDERYTDAESLKEDAEAKLDELSKPYRSYTAEIINLVEAVQDEEKKEQYKEVFSIALGDTVLLISKSTGIRESHRIVKFYEYPLTKEKNKVELANTRLSFEEVQRTEQELS